jgi:hypothetical protein
MQNFCRMIQAGRFGDSRGHALVLKRIRSRLIGRESNSIGAMRMSERTERNSAPGCDHVYHVFIRFHSWSFAISETWRKRVGVEPTGDRKTCRPPVLKTGRITGPHALPCRCPDLPFHVSWRAGSMPRTMGILQNRQSVPRGTFCTSVYVLILPYIMYPKRRQ